MAQNFRNDLERNVGTSGSPATLVTGGNYDAVIGIRCCNTSAATILIDNFVTRFSATDTLLQNDTFDVATTNFSVSPNPANDFVTISNSENISVNSISMTDLNGRVVKQNSYSNVSEVQVNISDLASGVYMMNIKSDKGSVTKKIIKN